MKDTLHVAVDASSLSLGFVGLGVYTERLIKLLQRVTGIKVTLIADENSLQRLPKTDFPVRSYPSRSFLPGPLAGYHRKHRAASLALDEFPDAYFLSPSPMWALRAPRRRAVVVHDLIYRHFPWYEGRYPLRRILNRLCESFACKSHSIITVSEFSKMEIVRELHQPPTHVSCIPNWIEDSFITTALETDIASLRKRYHLPENFWLYVGGYDYRKNVEALLTAYAQARSRIPCPPLVLAGHIPQHHNRTLCNVQGAIERLKLGSFVVLPGSITAADLPGLYRSAALFVSPSRFEGFGYPPLEANAVGTPALVADNSSLREIVPFAENRFPEDQPEKLADLLASIAAGKHEVRLFPWDQYTESRASKNWTMFFRQVSQTFSRLEQP